MAVNDGFNKTSQNDLVQGVDIDALILGMGRQARIYQDIALINPQVKLPTWRIVTSDLITVNSTLAEADEASFTSFTTSGVEITPSVYPVRSHVSLELDQDSAIDVLTKAIADHTSVIMDAIDTNVLAQISSATNTTDHNGTSLDKTKFQAALLLFKKQARDPGQLIFVGSYRQIHEIIGAYADAGGTAFSRPEVAPAVGSDPSQYFRQFVEGVALFEGLVPDSGASDVSGAFMVQGKALALGFWQMLGFRLDVPNGRVGDELFTWSRYGTGIARQANMREVISLK
ncbi:hypothetical protein [Nannocystis pusilla]|uniref:hypothetical protein n=1 Tax=Nannocystis pusilla TaxID=889268 RepID=UPI003DA3D9F3